MVCVVLQIFSISIESRVHCKFTIGHPPIGALTTNAISHWQFQRRYDRSWENLQRVDIFRLLVIYHGRSLICWQWNMSRAQFVLSKLFLEHCLFIRLSILILNNAMQNVSADQAAHWLPIDHLTFPHSSDADNGWSPSTVATMTRLLTVVPAIALAKMATVTQMSSVHPSNSAPIPQLWTCPWDGNCVKATCHFSIGMISITPPKSSFNLRVWAASHD